MNKDLTELLTEFDEMGYAPTTLTAEPEKAASEWKKRLVEAIKAENAELKEKAQKLDEHLKAISDRTAKFHSLEQIEKRLYKCRLFKRKIKNNERCEECKDCEAINE